MDKKAKRKLSQMSAFGIWTDRPQTDYEGYEVLEQIKNLSAIKYLCESEVTYGCIDLRDTSRMVMEL